MIESIQAGNRETWAGVIDQHLEKVMNCERVASENRTLCEGKVRFLSDDDLVVDKLTEEALMSRQALLDYVPANRHEALDKALHVAALTIAQALFVEGDELSRLLRSLEVTDP